MVLNLEYMHLQGVREVKSERKWSKLFQNIYAIKIKRHTEMKHRWKENFKKFL
jgi:hypothetical protein